MPEADKEGERYAVDQPQQTPGFFLKGTHQLDWGMKNRMARVFDPTSGRTVMLAIDHGYFQGPTTGLERIDLSIVPLLPNCDALFCTRGILRSVIPAECQKPMVLRASGGPSILREELSDEQIAMDMDDAMRLNAAGVGIQVFIGGEFETRSVHNMTKLVDAGLRIGIPPESPSAKCPACRTAHRSSAIAARWTDRSARGLWSGPGNSRDRWRASRCGPRSDRTPAPCGFSCPNRAGGCL